jgi:group I intron endonuclease
MKVIYTILCEETNKQYIGSALNHAKRKREHFYNLKNNKHPNKKMQNAYNKYGVDCFEFKIIEIVNDETKLLEREQHYIDKLKPFYNICKVAGSSFGLKRTSGTRDKIRIANLGIKHPQWRNEIKSKAQGGEKHWTKKKRFSVESKKRMSETHKQKYKDGYKSPLSIPIIQYDLGGKLIAEWENCERAAKALNINRMAINNCVNNKTKTSNNFIWKRK